METLHAKSLCCRGSIYRFGKRRRQCAVCKRTWRIRTKRRGRNRKRINPRLAVHTLIERRTFLHQHRRGSISQSGFSRKLSKALHTVVQATQSRRLPSGPYALLGDGLYFKFKRMDWVMYVMAVKPVRSHRAFFLDPVLLPGKESYERWRVAVATIPSETKKRILAFVSDGFRGSQLISEQNHWLHQRCHFHLLAALVRGKGKRRYRIRSSALRDKILEATRILLCSRNAHALAQARKAIRTRIIRPNCPVYVRKQALEFLERENDFRTYLLHQRLTLPTTTNSIESTGRMIRKATSTARTSKSVLLRATAFLNLKKSIACNGKLSTKLCQ